MNVGHIDAGTPREFTQSARLRINRVCTVRVGRRMAYMFGVGMALEVVDAANHHRRDCLRGKAPRASAARSDLRMLYRHGTGLNDFEPNSRDR